MQIFTLRLLAPLALSASLFAADPVKVKLFSNLPSPQLVGTSIGFSPRLENAPRPPAPVVFRYSVSIGSEPFHIIQDFSQNPNFVWTPALVEHDARVHLTVRYNTSKETVDAEMPFHINSRVNEGHAIVTSTHHPLVALFSAPPCQAGDNFRVAFRPEKSTAEPVRTSLQPCRDKSSNNVFVAGMRADTAYQMSWEDVSGDSAHVSEWLPFHTSTLDGDFPAVSTPVTPTARDHTAEPLIVHSVIRMAGYMRPFAADLNGNIVWYLRPNNAWLTRIVPGGHFLTLAEGSNSANDIHRDQMIREFDLAGNMLRETNASRVAEQLESRGIHSDCKKGNKECVSGFHHEVLRLNNGHTLVIMGLERMYPAGTQGAKDPVDVLGDLIVDLDEDFQAVWLWNAFDHMDIKRKSKDDEKCLIGPGRGGCPSVFLAESANGWLHSNSLAYVPSDGSLIISMPEQNWVLKLNYKNGAGDGKVLWRLGDGGDFKTNSTDPEPWFSYQHDAAYEPIGSDLLSLIDDGRALQEKHPGAHSRGQVWKLDEAKKTAELVYNADLGVYTRAVGSAQKLKDGGYSFEAGFLEPGLTPYGQAVETSADGKIVYVQQVEGAIDYRSFRVADMYSAPPK